MPQYFATETRLWVGDFALFKQTTSSKRYLQPVKITSIDYLADNTVQIGFTDLQISYREIYSEEMQFHYFLSDADCLADFFLDYLKHLKNIADQHELNAIFAYANLSLFWSYHGQTDAISAMREAQHYFALASDLADAEASYTLANMYRYIVNPEYDSIFATNREIHLQDYLQKSAMQGDKTGQYQLAYFYEYAQQGFIQDNEKAVYWYQQSADQDYPQACNNLGDKYERGKGIQRDYEKAVMYYEKAVKHGIKEAMYNLGRLYLRGLGVVKDEIKGRDLLEQAAKQYYQPAIRKLKNLDKKS